MRKLPSLKAAILFASGIVLSYWLPLNPIYYLGFLLLLPCLLLITQIRRYTNVIAAFILVLIGALAYLASNPPEPEKPVIVTVEGIVAETPILRDHRITFPLKFLALHTPDKRLTTASGSLWVSGELDTVPALGSRLRVTGRLERFPELRNPGQFDLRRYRRADGMIGRLKFYSAGDIEVVNSTKPLLYSLRSGIDSACDTLGRWDAPLWKGLLLGFRRDLDPTLVEELRVTGLTHLLALSGLNIGFLAVALFGLLAIFPLSPSKRAIPALFIVILYTLLIPDRGCTVRASLMVSTALLGLILHRWSTALNTLGLAALLALIYRPGDLFDAGFQMSFAATGAILLFQPQILTIQQLLGRRGKISRSLARWVLTPLAISLVSSLAVAPVTAFHFFGIPLAGLLFNLWAVPLMGVIYAGAWLSLLCYPMAESTAIYIADGVLALGKLWTDSVHFAAGYAPIWEGFLPPLAVMSMIAIIIWMGVSRRKLGPRHLIGLFSLYLIAVAGSIRPKTAETHIWFLDVGHGDAAIWQTKSGVTFVVDGGPEESISGRNIIQTALRRLNITTIDVLVASHLEIDHIGGLIDAPNSFPVKMALIGGGSTNGKFAKRLIDNLTLHHVPIIYPSPNGMRIDRFDSTESVEILRRQIPLIKLSANNASIPMKLNIHQRSGDTLTFLTCGDLEAEGEDFLVRNEIIKAQLLKASHHGSATSSTPEFLTAVNPQDVVITRSSFNEMGSGVGRQYVLDRFKAAGIKVHRVDMESAILFKATDDGWKKVNWRNPSLFKWLLGRVD